MENEPFFQRSGRPVPEAAVLLIDLDNFKSINDRFGHAFGDRVLQMFAATACRAIRSSDFVGRLGGEEFAVVLHGLARERAPAVAERIRNAFAAEAEVIEGQNVGATVSIGLAVHDGSAIAFTELLWKADRALYRAKEGGRNRVEWAMPDFYSSRRTAGYPWARHCRRREASPEANLPRYEPYWPRRGSGWSSSIALMDRRAASSRMP